MTTSRVGWCFIAGLLVPGAAQMVHADVLCTRPGGGTVRVRVACQSNEVQLDPVALGLQGPAGSQGPQGQGLNSAKAAAAGPQCRPASFSRVIYRRPSALMGRATATTPVSPFHRTANSFA